MRTPLHHLTGADLTQIDGIAPYTALKLLSEIGTDLSRWPTEKHFTAWLTLAPQNKVSGGRRLSSRTQPSANRAAAMLRMAALSLVRGQTALGAFYRRLAVRVGKPKALTATARKLAILVYRTLTGTLVYRDTGPTPTTPANAHGSCADSANAPTRWALLSSIARPARYLEQQFLRRRAKGLAWAGRLFFMCVAAAPRVWPRSPPLAGIRRSSASESDDHRRPIIGV